MNWYKKAIEQNFPSSLTSEEMESFILEKGLRDFEGKMDYETAHYIASHVNKWVLTEISLDSFPWIADPKYKNVSKNFPPIVLKVDGKCQVLDGKHRIGMAKAIGLKSIKVYLGEINELV